MNLKLIPKHLTKLTVGEKARDIWKTMDDNGKAIVRFGMFPSEIMKEAAAEGYDGRDLAVALMDCAEADGGMVA